MPADDQGAKTVAAARGWRARVMPISLLYGTYFIASGLHAPYFPIWLRAHGIGDDRVALVLAIPMILRIVMAPVFGLIADRVGNRALVIRVMAVLTLAFTLCLGQSGQFWVILGFSGLMLTIWQGMSPIIDASALNLVRRGIAADYGHMRLWGSITFIVASLVGGALLGWFGPLVVFASFSVAMAGMTATTFALPDNAAAPACGHAANAGVLRRKIVFAVFVAAALIQASQMAFNGFGTISLREHGFSDVAIGVLWALATTSEVFMFWAGAWVSRRFTPVTLLMSGAIAAALRWSLFSLDLGPWVLVLVLLQLAHALTFSGTYLGLMRFISTAVQERRATAVQSTYTTIQGTVMAGAMLGAGPVYQAFGGAVFLASGGMALLALGILVAVRPLLAPVAAGCLAAPNPGR